MAGRVSLDWLSARRWPRRRSHVVVITPTLRMSEVPGDVDAQTGWKSINVTDEGIPESVYREASWYIGPGHANDALRLEVRIEPFDSVMFGRVLAPADWLNDAVQRPAPGIRAPMLVQRPCRLVAVGARPRAFQDRARFRS